MVIRAAGETRFKLKLGLSRAAQLWYQGTENTLEALQEGGVRHRLHELVGKKCFCHCSLDEVCHVDENLKVMDDEQRARARDDRPPDLSRMSLAEVGLALKSHLRAPRSEPAASVENFVLRHSDLERGGISKDILPFPLSFCPTAAEISLSLKAGRAQLSHAEGAEAALDEYISFLEFNK